MHNNIRVYMKANLNVGRYKCKCYKFFSLVLSKYAIILIRSYIKKRTMIKLT